MAMKLSSKDKIVKAFTAPNKHVSPLLTAVLVLATHLLFNSILLSPINSSRCFFFKMEHCPNDVAWILNWFGFCKFHLGILLTCLGLSVAYHPSGVGSTVWMESKMGFLAIIILTCYLQEGIFLLGLEQVDRPMAIFQALIMVSIMLVVLLLTRSQEMQPGSAFLSRPFRSRSASISFSHRRKIAIPTVALGVQAVLSTFRAFDMALGSLKEGYLGDPNSQIFQNISNLTTCDVMLLPVVMIFALFFCTVDQHRATLKGHVAAVFAYQVVLSTSQGDMVAKEQVQMSMLLAFCNIVFSVVGAC